MNDKSSFSLFEWMEGGRVGQEGSKRSTRDYPKVEGHDKL